MAITRDPFMILSKLEIFILLFCPALIDDNFCICTVVKKNQNIFFYKNLVNFSGTRHCRSTFDSVAEFVIHRRRECRTHALFVAEHEALMVSIDNDGAAFCANKCKISILGSWYAKQTDDFECRTDESCRTRPVFRHHTRCPADYFRIKLWVLVIHFDLKCKILWHAQSLMLLLKFFCYLLLPVCCITLFCCYYITFGILILTNNVFERYFVTSRALHNIVLLLFYYFWFSDFDE